MDRLLLMKPYAVWWIYLLLDVLAVGMGMGVPIFAILLGFPVGWYVGRRVLREGPVDAGKLLAMFRTAVATAAPTLAMMAVIWLPPLVMLRDPSFDPGRFGQPYFLYDPLLSFIGWIVLMVMVSPVLQAMAAIVGAFAAAAYGAPNPRSTLPIE